MTKPSRPKPGAPWYELERAHCFILDRITPTSAQEDAAPPDVPPFTFFITVQLATTLTVSALEFQNKIPQRLDKEIVLLIYARLFRPGIS